MLHFKVDLFDGFKNHGSVNIQKNLRPHGIDPCMGKVEVEKTSFFLGAAPRDDFHGGKLAISFREFAPFSPT